MNRYRILLVSHAYVTPINRQKASALAASGDVEVTLLIPARWDAPVPGLERDEPYRLIKLPVSFPGRGGAHFYLKGLSKLVKEFRPHIIHLEEEPWAVSAFQFSQMKRMHRFRLILFSWENLVKSFHGIRGWMEAMTLQQVDLGIGGNFAAARELNRKGVTHVRVLPQLGVNPDEFRPREKPVPQVFTIGYAGRVGLEKGVDLLIRAVAGLEGEWHLKILGQGAEQEALYALAKRLSVLDKIEFLPSIPHENVAEFMQSIEVLVLPSRTTNNWAEQFGHVLVEAMSSEIPVVASMSGSIPEVVGNGGLLFPEGDEEFLRTVLERVRDEPDLARKLGQTGRLRVLERYAWEHIADETLRYYRELMDEATPSSVVNIEEEKLWGLEHDPTKVKKR